MTNYEKLQSIDKFAFFVDIAVLSGGYTRLLDQPLQGPISWLIATNQLGNLDDIKETINEYLS